MDSCDTVEIMFEFSKAIRTDSSPLRARPNSTALIVKESAPCLNLSVSLMQKRRRTSYR